MGSFEGIIKAYAEGAVFVAFDIETTGLNPRLDHIVEMGAVKFDRKGLIARFSTLINPGVPMPGEAEKVNHISDRMLRGKPPLLEVLPDFVRFIRGAVLAAHNAPFDCAFINEKLKEYWDQAKPGKEGAFDGPETAWRPPYPSLPNGIADTLLFSREVFPGRRSYSLQNLAADLGLAAGNAHRGEDDAALCKDLFLRCLEAETAKKPSKQKEV